MSMKIAIANTSRQSLGGGWSFIDNLVKGSTEISWVDWKEADLILIPSASMIQKDLFREMKASGKKIVLRVDNALRNSRNRSTGMNRMKEFAQAADVVVYQSTWAMNYLCQFLDYPTNKLIYNGIDLGEFREKGPLLPFKGNPVFLYSRYSRDESKMWIKAWYEYQQIQKDFSEAKLIIVGRFSDALRAGDFDFFQGENFEYIGIAQDKQRMSQILRGVDYLMAPYHMDCFSNTYVEALCSGVKLWKPDLSGGTEEIINLFRTKGRDHFDCRRMANEYKSLFREVLK